MDNQLILMPIWQQWWWEGPVPLGRLSYDLLQCNPEGQKRTYANDRPIATCPTFSPTSEVQ